MPWGTLDPREFHRRGAGRRPFELDGRRLPGAPHRRRLRVDAAGARRGVRAARSDRGVLALPARRDRARRAVRAHGDGAGRRHRAALRRFRALRRRRPGAAAAAARYRARRPQLLRRRGALDSAPARHLDARHPPARRARCSAASCATRPRTAIVGWTLPRLGAAALDADGVAFVRRTAEAAIGEIRRLWDASRAAPAVARERRARARLARLGRVPGARRRSLRTRVVAPFAARGIDVSAAAAD